MVDLMPRSCASGNPWPTGPFRLCGRGSGRRPTRVRTVVSALARGSPRRCPSHTEPTSSAAFINSDFGFDKAFVDGRSAVASPPARRKKYFLVPWHHHQHAKTTGPRRTSLWGGCGDRCHGEDIRRSPRASKAHTGRAFSRLLLCNQDRARLHGKRRHSVRYMRIRRTPETADWTGGEGAEVPAPTMFAHSWHGLRRKGVRTTISKGPGRRRALRSSLADRTTDQAARRDEGIACVPYATAMFLVSG